MCLFSLGPPHLQLARMVSALQQQQQQQQQQQRQPSMKHSPSHPVGPKPHLDNMVPNALNVGLPDLQTKGPIPGYGSGKVLVCKLPVEESASHILSLRVRPPLHYFHTSHAGSVNILIPFLQVRYLIC